MEGRETTQDEGRETTQDGPQGGGKSSRSQTSIRVAENYVASVRFDEAVLVVL